MGPPYACAVSVISFISPCQAINYTSSPSVSWGVEFLSTLNCCGSKRKILNKLCLGLLGTNVKANIYVVYIVK